MERIDIEQRQCHNLTMNKETIKTVLDILEETYPDAECALHHQNLFELIVAVALSAQTTDKSVNQVTPELFSAYPDARSLSEANPEEVGEYLKRIGMYRTKAKNIINMSKLLMEKYDGQVPEDYDALVDLPGVGRKTANVVLSVGFGQPRIAVDTHVFRVANRIGLGTGKDVLETELSLMKRIPKARWSRTHHSLIFHGRNCCTARNPNCKNCPILEFCEKSSI
ncbi:endonuclease-3 [Clostridiales Family XIII bacterium PM5-7]